MTNRWRAMSAGAAAAVACVLLAGCGDAIYAGDAAVIGPSTITTQALADDVEEIQEVRGTYGQSEPMLVASVLQRQIITELIAQAAAREGVSVTQAEIDAARQDAVASVGGEEALEQAFLDSNVAPSDIPGQIALSITVDALSSRLAPDGPPEQQQGVLFGYVVSLAQELGVLVNPRFGTWQVEQLQVGPPPTDLASPPADPADLSFLPQPQG